MEPRDPGRGAGGRTPWLAFSLTAALLAGCGSVAPTSLAPSADAPVASMPTGVPTPLATSPPAPSPDIGATPVPTVAPTTVPTTPLTVSPPLGSDIYIVVAGDTLWDLAQWYGVTVDALLAVNPQIADSSLIRVGDRIVIPPSNTTGGSPLPGRVVRIDFSRAGKLSAFDPRFFEQDGVVFPPQFCPVDVCSDWFVGWIQGDDALVGGPISATFTRSVSSLSVRAAPGAQGTAEYTLTAFDRGGEVIAMKSVVVAQYIADPQVTPLGYFVVELGPLSKPARRFTFEQKDLDLPAGMAGIGYGLAEISFTVSGTAVANPTSPGIALNTPTVGATIAQNVASAGCSPNATRGNGFVVNVEWAVPSVEDLAEYELVVQRIGSLYPALKVSVATPTFIWTACNTFVIDANLANWQWQVTALNNDRQVIAVSEQRAISFLPCRVADGATACSAPG